MFLAAADISGHNIGFNRIVLGRLGRRTVFDGIDAVKHRFGPRAIAQHRGGNAQPCRCMAVLPPIFADPRRIGLDITGIARRCVKGGMQQANNVILRTHQFFKGTVESLPCPKRITAAGDHRPRLGEGIDAAFIVGLRAPVSTLIINRPDIPLAIPTMAINGIGQHPGARKPNFGKVFAVPLASKFSEITDGGRHKPAQPDALALARAAHPVHPVIPVAVADQWQTVVAQTPGTPKSAQAMFMHRRFFPFRKLRETIMLLSAQLRCLQKGHFFVQQQSITGSPDILGHRMGKPEQVVRTARPHPSSGRRMPPVQDISL